MEWLLQLQLRLRSDKRSGEIQILLIVLVIPFTDACQLDVMESLINHDM